jgi:HemY protein
MKSYRLLLWGLGLAALGALLFGLLAEDPGYLLLEWRGYAIESTAVAALALVVVAWLLLRVLLGLLLWPLRAWRRHGERTARRRLADGLLAAQRGEHATALKLLNRAARRARFRVPALMAAADSARALADDAAEQRVLSALDDADAESARLARSRSLLARDDSAAALVLLRAAAEPAAPAIRVERMRAALAEGEAGAALQDLRALKAGAATVPAELEAETLAAALRHSPDLELLRQRMAELPRSEPLLVAAFADRARALDAAELADDAIEQSLRKQWDERLVADYGRAGRGDQRERIRRAEAWLEEHRDSPALQLALGRLCRIDGLWGKAEAHLLRASHGPHAAAAWEELALAFVAQGEELRARQALQNALAAQRGQVASTLTARARTALGVGSEAIERRSSMGVPLLADGSAPQAD